MLVAADLITILSPIVSALGSIASIVDTGEKLELPIKAREQSINET